MCTAKCLFHRNFHRNTLSSFAAVAMLMVLTISYSASASSPINFTNIYRVRPKPGAADLVPHRIHSIGPNNAFIYVPVYFKDRHYVMIYNYTWTGTSTTIYLLDSRGTEYHIRLIDVLPSQEASSAAVAVSGDSVYVAVSWFQYDFEKEISSIYLREYRLGVRGNGETVLLSASPVMGPVFIRGIPGPRWLGYGYLEDYLHVYVMYGYKMVVVYHEKLHRFIAVREDIDPYCMPAAYIARLGERYLVMNTSTAYMVSMDTVSSYRVGYPGHVEVGRNSVMAGIIPVKEAGGRYTVLLMRLTPIDMMNSIYAVDALTYSVGDGVAYRGRLRLGRSSGPALSYIYLGGKLYVFYTNSTGGNATVIKILSFADGPSIDGSVKLYNAFPYSFAAVADTGTYIVVDAVNGIYVADPGLKEIVYKPLQNVSMNTHIYSMMPIDIDNDSYTEIVYIEVTHKPGGEAWISYFKLYEDTFTELNPAPEPPVPLILLAIVIINLLIERKRHRHPS